MSLERPNSTDSEEERIIESDGSYCMTRYFQPCPTEATASPLLICFHGSGSDHLPSWNGLLKSLGQRYRTIFFDRGPLNPVPEEHIKVVWNFLATRQLGRLNIILVAHSYGGLFAKHFLNSYSDSVGGMVLVETGKGGSSDHVQTRLIKSGRLGSKPLSVIRGNSFLQQQKIYETVAADEIKDQNPNLQLQTKEYLQRCEEEDEKLEKEQLKLSINSRYVHLPDCGHNVVRDRPDVVLQEVQWVIEHRGDRNTRLSWLDRMKLRFSK